MKKLCLIILLYLSYSGVSQEEITPYVSVVEHSTIKKWINNSKVVFDDQGIVKQNGSYHPLSIMQYGVFSYHAFYETNDSSYYHGCINQFHYFLDTAKTNLIHDGHSLGLPYTFNYKDLKQPWYSGMTQGYALSYVLRYYELTQDERALEIAPKIANMLLVPVREGGTLGKTPEGLNWIEEYPGSSQKPEVLNGFINGWIGLFEYCQRFSDDTLAHRIMNETYDALKATLSKYDTADWTKYDRGNSPVDTKYMRYEITEMLHLYQLTGDEQFKKQMMLWSSFVYNKFITANNTHFKRPHYNFSVPTQTVNETEVPTIQYENLLSPFHVAGVSCDGCAYDSVALAVFQGTISETVLDSTTSSKKRKYSFKLNFVDTIIADVLKLNFANGVLLGTSLKIYYYDLSKEKLKRFKEFEIAGDVNSTTIIFEDPLETNLLEIRIQYKNEHRGLDIIAAELINTEDEKVPMFAHHKSEPFEVKSSEINVTIPFLNSPYAVTFYKFAPTEQGLGGVKWETANTFVGAETTLTANPGFIQFLTVFEVDGIKSGMSKIIVTN